MVVSKIGLGCFWWDPMASELWLWISITYQGVHLGPLWKGLLLVCDWKTLAKAILWWELKAVERRKVHYKSTRLRSHAPSAWGAAGSLSRMNPHVRWGLLLLLPLSFSLSQCLLLLCKRGGNKLVVIFSRTMSPLLSLTTVLCQSWSVRFPFKANLAWLTQWLVRMVWFWTPSTSQTAILRECPSLEHASDRTVEWNWISSRTTGEVHCPQEIPSRWTPQLSSDLYLLWLSPGMWFQNWPRFYPHS